MRALSAASSSMSNRAGARPKLAKSKLSISGAHVGERLDRQAGADPRQLRHQGSGLDPRLAHRLDAERAEPLRELALRADQQRLVGEGRRRRAQRREHLELKPGIGDMVLAAHDMGHAHVDIVDHARQHVEPAAVLAADHRIAEQGRDRNAGARG